MIRRLLILFAAVVLVLKTFPAVADWVAARTRNLTWTVHEASSPAPKHRSSKARPRVPPARPPEPAAVEPSWDQIRNELERLKQGGRQR